MWAMFLGPLAAILPLSPWPNELGGLMCDS